MAYYDTDKTGSAFNPALKYVESIAKLLDILDGYYLKEDYLKVHSILTRIYQRIEHKLTEGESKLIQEGLNLSLQKLKTTGKKRKNKIETFFNDLNKIEKHLKRYMDKYSLLMPSKEDPRFAVLKR